MKTNQFSKLKGVFAILFTIAFITSNAQIVAPGSDRLNTSIGGGTYLNLPLPAGFFGPGSDPFFGVVNFQGAPLNTSPANAFGPTDVIVRRLGPGSLIPCPSSDVVPIEMLALDLKSVMPITVSYNGGSTTDNWNVDICLTGVVPQQPGNMQINKTNSQGGTFSATLPVIPKLTFTRMSPPTTLILDYPNVPVFMFNTTGGNWVFNCPSCTPTPGGITVDNDCNGSFNATVPPSSNFFPGISSNGDCINPGTLTATPFVLGAPAQGAQHSVETPFPQQNPNSVPTLPQWALLIFGFLLVFAGGIFILKK